MSNLVRAFTPDNPLMQPVQYGGQDYFTSQYFHQGYLVSSPYGGKYRQHSNFLQAIRAIPAYAKYLADGDIAELEWSQVKSRNQNQVPYATPEANELFIYLKPLFHAAGYRPLTLLNGTAQLAMHQQLDDEESQRIAVATNRTVARQASSRALASSTPMELSSRDYMAFLVITHAMHIPEHIAQQEAVKMIDATHGVNLRPLLLAAPAQDNIPVAAKMLEPMDLATEFGWARTIQGGAWMNKRLEAVGWQVRKIGGSGWDATPEGLLHCAAHAWSEKGHSGYNYKWRLADVRQAFSTSRLDVQTPTHAQEER